MSGPWGPRPAPRAKRLILWACAGLAGGALLVAAFLAQRPPSAREDVAHVIAAGEANAAAADDAGEDPDLAADEAAAGAMWAARNYPANAAACPRYYAAFQRGCSSATRRP